MMRNATRGRPELLLRAITTGAWPKRSRSGMATPARALRTNRCATEASICCHGMREDSTASGWRRSIMWSMRERKKSSVAGQVSMKNSQKSTHRRIKLGEILPENSWFCKVIQGVGDFSGAATYSTTKPSMAASTFSICASSPSHSGKRTKRSDSRCVVSIVPAQRPKRWPISAECSGT